MRIFLLLTLFFTSSIFSQLSDKHWLPPLHSRSNSNVGEHVIYLSTPVITPFQVTVTNGNGILFGTYTVSAGNPVQFTVGNSQPSNMFVSQTGLYTPSGDNGLILTGPANFYVTFKVRSSAHGEVFVSKGRAGLGQDFRLGGVPQIANDGSRNFVSSIMATENNTFITVNDYNTGVTFVTPTGTNNSGTQSFNLQAGESVVLSGYSNVVANLDGFIGAHLTSNKPVSVITGNITANPASTGNDICLDQIVPVEEVGSEYIVVKGNGISTTELPIVIGTENNTQIFVNGIATPIATINAGDYYIVPFSYYQGTNNQNMYIESSKPVYLYQVLAGDAATYTTGLNFIPPLSCSYPKVVDLIPSINFLGSLNVNLDGSANLVLLAVVGSVISINGTVTTAVPQTVLGNANWVTYRIPNVSGNVKVESTGSVAVGVYGTSNTIGFASFYSGFGKVQISYTQDQGIETADMTSANGLAQCAGNVKVLNTNVDPDDFDFQWSIVTPTGLEDIPGETEPSYTVTAPGTYCVTTSNGFVGSSCTQIDCIEVEYLPEFFINDNPTDLALYSCDNNFDLSTNIPVILDGLNEFDYEIFFFASEQDAIDNENQISEIQLTNSNSTTFYTRVEDFIYGCPKFTQFEALVVPPPTATISADTICSNSTGTVTFTGTPGASVLYTVDGLSQQPITLDNATGIATITTPILNNNSTYCLVDVSFASSTSCNQTLSDCATVMVLPLPTATISGDIICEGASGTVTISGTPGASVQYSIDGSSTNSSVLLDAFGNATIATPVLLSNSEYCLVDVTSTDNCSQSLTNQCATITVIPLPTASISGQTICEGTTGTVTISGTPNATVQYSVDGSSVNQSIVLDLLGNATITTPALTTNSEYCLLNITSATIPACTKTFNTPICTTVIVNPLPLVSITGEDACLGEANIITFTGTPNAVVNYNLDATPQLPIVLNASGSYILNSTNAVGPHTYTAVDVTSADTPSCSVSLVGEEIIVNVLTSPVIGLITDIRICDDNNDGYGTFDLSSAVSEALVGNSGTTVTIHETQADADFPSNALSLAELVSYNNIVPLTQELFVRVENSAGCFTTTSFFVHVDQRPELNQNVASYELCETSIPGDGFEVFDLTNSDLTNDITAGVSGLTLYYYESQADALANTTANALASPNAFTNTVADSQTIYVTAVNAAGCIDVTSVDLIVNPLPEITPLNPMNGCSDGVNPNSAPFDLTLNDDLVTAGQSGYTVTYYLDQAAADAAVSGTELASPYNSISNPQTVYVRVQNDATGCYSTTTLELNVTQGPVANTPAALHYCDPNNDGYGTFNLEDTLNDISGGITPIGVNISFHETPEDATFGTNAIDTSVLYNNIVENLQTIYISVSYDLTGCANYTQLQLIVDPTPELVAPTDPLQECDDVLADGMAQFDLTQVETEVLNGINPTTVTITYHLTQQNAVDGTPNISNVLNYNGTNGQTIYIRVTYNATGCFAVESFDLVVNSLPIMPAPEDITMSLCDLNNTGDQIECFDLESQIPLIINGQIDMIVTFHPTQLDAINNTATLSSPYCNTSNAQSIFVRLENELTGCFNTVIMDLRVEPLPLIVVPDPIEECDADGDGFATFDLTALITDMLNGASDVTLTFYETFDDANQPSNEIPNPAFYQNIDPLNQIVYVRAENDLTGCYTIEMIELVVHPAPLMPELDNLVICDTNYDGQAYFDLTQQNTDILAGNTIAASQLQIRYYTNATSAMNGTNAITVPTNYLSQLPPPQTIWVVVTDLVTGCKATGTFDLIVNLPIDVRNQNNRLTLCDDVLPNDQFTSFDLTVMNAQITLNTPGTTVIYYPSVTDMNNGTNAIGTPTDYTNALPAVQTLGVLVTTAAGCTSKTTLTIRVEPLPTPKTDPTALISCDDDQTFIGTELFDVTVNESYIQDGYPNLSFEYYASMDDLNNGVQIPDATLYEGGDALATPPKNIVYIKVMNNRTDSFGENCYQIVEQELIVNPLPAITDTTFVLCDDDSDGMAVFTLSDYNEQLLGATQLPADFTVSYYDTQANAQAGTSVGLLSNTYNGTNLEMIYPLVIDNATGCRNALATVTLSVKLRAVANPISQTTLDLFSVCDYDGINDGFTTFDLTAVETELLGAQITPPISITYHLTPEDQASGANAIANPASYTNTTVLTETIYIRVARANDDPSDDSAPCYDVSQILINVEPLAEPFITSVTGSETICVNELTGDVNPNSFLTLDSGVPAGSGYTYQWFLDGVALTTGTNATYEVNTDAPGIYTVVVTSTSVLGCVSDVSNDFTVIRSGPAVNQEYTVSNAFEDLQNIQVTNDGYGEYHYQLDDGPILDNGGLFLDVTPGPHTITIYDVKTNNPCDAVTITGVSVINYPHYFTPNGDGIHDNWNIIGLDNQPNAKIYIFDRYGKLIKQISATSEGWNGTFNGQPLPSTDYWFSVDYLEGVEQKQFKAHFTLKR